MTKTETGRNRERESNSSEDDLYRAGWWWWSVSCWSSSLSSSSTTSTDTGTTAAASIDSKIIRTLLNPIYHKINKTCEIALIIVVFLGGSNI